VADRRGPITPLWQTADWTYLRFHAGRATPRSCYGAGELEEWAGRVEAGWGRDATGFVYFNNDGNGCALRDASVLARALAERGVELSSCPVVPDDVLHDRGVFKIDADGGALAGPGVPWRR
jgi:uncharacterized protein YecE (DUF72 family)